MSGGDTLEDDHAPGVEDEFGEFGVVDGFQTESADQPEARPRVLQLRVVIEADDYDEAVRFFRDVLSLPTLLSYENPDDDRVVILEAGQATLEIGTSAHSRVIDRLEGATEPPWGSLNARVVGPAATHQTFFQQLEPGPERGPTV